MTASERRAAWRSLVVPGAATLVALAILVTLGLWQLERKTWKEGLLAAIAARAYGDPGAAAPETAWPTWRASEDEFRRVAVAGEFLHDREVPVHGLAELRPRQASQGFYVFTPLRQPDGSVIVINRGFVPTEMRQPASRPAGQTAGPVRVTGLVRSPEERSAFVPANDPARDEWFVRDLAEIAASRTLTRVAPFYVDADPTPNPGGWPRGGQTRVDLPNDHLHYALTWFGLALTLVGVFAAFAWRRLNPPEAPEAGAPAEPARP